MRRIPLILMLLTGVNSCASFSQDPGMSAMPYARKDCAPTNVAWTRPDGSPAQQNYLAENAQPGPAAHLPPAALVQAPLGPPPSPTARGSSPTGPTAGSLSGQPTTAGKTFFDVGMMTAYAGPDTVAMAKPASTPAAEDRSLDPPIVRTSYVPPAPAPKPVQEKRQSSELPPIIDTKTALELQPPPLWPLPNPGSHDLNKEGPLPPKETPALLPFSVTSGNVSTAEQEQTVGPSPTFRMFNSKRFTLNYEVRDGGANGPSHVEVWGTRDLRTWKRYDAVQQSPHMHVIEVKEEGTYGFTMVARNSAGEGKDSPKPGELPQLWVTVDTLKPVVQLLGVEMSLTSKSPSLVVRWLATDKNFGKRPITVSFAEQAEGPWLPLATGMDNTGRSELPVTSHLPKRTYLRVEATDLAGNVGTSQTVNPLRLDVYVSGAIVAPAAEGPKPTVTPPTVSITSVEPTAN
jgi:hypothetical protein